jgi:PHD/YefM family antitoxin component YafN of YafNO toxin-antitoxin module
MNAIRGAIENTVSISLFNKGQAGKIFADVRHCGAKVVMKNNAPECVLLAPDEYIKLMDEVNDARLLTLAAQRMEHFDPSMGLTQADVDAALGFSPDDLAGAEEIEFE